MVLAGDDEALANESRECVDCDEAEDERRNDDRRLFREKRWRMVWKRILTDFFKGRNGEKRSEVYDNRSYVVCSSRLVVLRDC